MMICEKCGCVYEDSEAFETSYIYDSTPFGRVAIARASDLKDCDCGGQLAPAKKCSACGVWIPEDSRDVCDECLDAAETVDVAIALGDINTVPIEVNGFAASVLGSEEINRILNEYARNYASDGDAAVKRYVRNDDNYLAEVFDAISEAVGV